jgi:hypothetical protein
VKAQMWAQWLGACAGKVDLYTLLHAHDIIFCQETLPWPKNGGAK